MLHILSSLPPWFKYKDYQVAIVISRGMRIQRDIYPPDTFTDLEWMLMDQCWDTKPSARPGMSSVALRLKCWTDLTATILPMPNSRDYHLAKARLDQISATPNQFASLNAADLSFEYPKEQYSHLRDLTGQIVVVDTCIFANGGYGDLWKGEMSEENLKAAQSTPPHHAQVAIKVVQRRNAAQWYPLNQRLLKEATLWNELRHPNILPFYGICFGLIAPTFPGLVCPYYSNHNAAEYLRMRPKTNRIAMICEVAAGLSYMHSRNITHGDIKSSNILVNDEGMAAICDFGMSRKFKETDGGQDLDDTDHAPGGSWRWMDCPTADESSDDTEESTPSVSPAILSKAADIWAFSMTILEASPSLPCSFIATHMENQIITGKLPWYWITQDTAALTEVMKGLRPTRDRYPEITSDYIWQTLEDCWVEPGCRPSMQRLYESFESFRADM
ncbi:hypothetical protein HWV62_9639 [Athelia sp. TMB]|nr:hypothetical protein HWV62_9639 [Athelia sp. TMB]